LFISDADLAAFSLNVSLGALLSILFIAINFTPRSKRFVHESEGFSLEQENEVTVKQFFSWEHFEFLFPTNKHTVYKLLDPFLYGLVFCICGEATRMRSLQTALDLSSYFLVYVFLWVALCLSVFSLVSNPPTETAVFRSEAGFNHLYRGFYFGSGILAALVLQ